MEKLKWKAVLVGRLQDIFDDVKMANHLVEAGKEIPCDRRLQGVRTKLVNLMEAINKEMPEDFTYVVPENVAQENTTETE